MHSPSGPHPASTPVRALPATGTLTFLFTDVEGSTPLWERYEDTMRAVTARHDALLDSIITAHGGTRVRERGEGDSIFAVFVAPAGAVAAALAIAQAVLAGPWPQETPIRVRMGLHTGGAQLRAGTYYGPVVNRCARIRGLGHGGQVLLSAATAALVMDALPAGASLRSLGAHSLKGLSAPEEVYQLCHPGLPGEFPSLLSPRAPKHNLPQALSNLIGREAEQGEVLALLAEARLVTLVGTGGVGKTRLALAVAAELVDQYADGVWLADLAALAEETLVPAAVAQILGVQEEPGRPLTATLADHLREKRLLLVLDNCEHLIGACAALASALLRACPGLRVLATSREALEVAGERRWRVPSLTVPDPRHLPPPEITGSYEAVRLFVTRAKERRADFALTPHNARVVAQVCARLDGIALAIELAAARISSLSVEGIAARLDDRFRLLTGGARDALPRQRTLRAALDWSYDLLSEPEQLLLDRLSVFAGGRMLGAAEAVCAGDGVEGKRLGESDDLADVAKERLGGSSDLPGTLWVLGKWEILDLLGSLMNKSLVHAEEREGGEVRYGLLETVRQYGQERLAAAGGLERVRDRHLVWYLALAEEAEPHLSGAAQVTWLDRLEAEHDNLRAALRWAREHGAAEEGLRLAAALWTFWYMRGYFSEGRQWLEDVLAIGAGAPVGDQGSLPALAHARALIGAGVLAFNQGAIERASTLLGEGLALSRELGNAAVITTSLNYLGLVARDQGDWERAATLHEESLILMRKQGDARGIATALDHLGRVARDQGDWERAASLHEESLILMRELGDMRGIATALDNLGLVAYGQGDYERAAVLLADSLALRRELGDKMGIAYCLLNLGMTAHALGDYGRATMLHEEGLVLAMLLGEIGAIAQGLEGLARVAVTHANPECAPRRAALLLAASATQRATMGLSLPPVEQARVEQARNEVRAALGTDASAVWAEGLALALDEAVALALQTAAPA